MLVNSRRHDITHAIKSRLNTINGATDNTTGISKSLTCTINGVANSLTTFGKGSLATYLIHNNLTR